jgi:hypothetical protein
MVYQGILGYYWTILLHASKTGTSARQWVAGGGGSDFLAWAAVAGGGGPSVTAPGPVNAFNAGSIVPGGVKFVVPGEKTGAWRCAKAGLVTESLGPGLGVIFLLQGRSSLWRRLTVLCLADPWVACPE